MTTTDDIRGRLALALDLPDVDRAEQLAKELAPWFGVAKVGLELYSAAGPEAITRMHALDLDVFADLKLHDIPTTVGRAARVIGRLGVRFLNFHAAGGADMLRAGVDGLVAGAAEVGAASPTAIAVTVLTSDPDASAFETRLAAAIDGGCGGVVCSMHEVERVHAARADLVTIVPGVRFGEGSRHDQARVGTPRAAIGAGADVLVVGRAVTGADHPRDAAARVFDEVADAITGSGR